MEPMSEIERILRTDKSVRDHQTEPVQQAEVLSAEASLRFAFPPSYREFLAFGGLSELRMNHRVLSPSQIVENARHVDQAQYIPFADNGCGDLYCWRRSSGTEPPVVFADHETGEYLPDAQSFVEWLAGNRF